MDTQNSDFDSLVRRDYVRCHPGDSFARLKRGARFTKVENGLIADWLDLSSRRYHVAMSWSESR